MTNDICVTIHIYIVKWMIKQLLKEKEDDQANVCTS